jgi:hypothetical protein
VRVQLPVESQHAILVQLYPFSFSGHICHLQIGESRVAKRHQYAPAADVCGFSFGPLFGVRSR